jgi:transcriptional regulator with XRE-family HTH domain
MAKKSGRVDVLVGHNIRAQRMACGMSQEGLARHLGVTFQQVQKYEKGVNRVGSGRLYQIARVFDVSIAAFFEGADPARTAEGAPAATALFSPLQLIAEPQAFRLLQAFSKLEHSGLRRTVVSLIEQMVNVEPESR